MPWPWGHRRHRGGSPHSAAHAATGASQPQPQLPPQRRRHKGGARCGLFRGCHHVPKEMPGHDMAFVAIGTFMLWYGW
jgi:ammonia channel protein AmtB